MIKNSHYEYHARIYFMKYSPTINCHNSRQVSSDVSLDSYYFPFNFLDLWMSVNLSIIE